MNRVAVFRAGNSRAIRGDKVTIIGPPLRTPIHIYIFIGFIVESIATIN